VNSNIIDMPNYDGSSFTISRDPRGAIAPANRYSKGNVHDWHFNNTFHSSAFSAVEIGAVVGLARQWRQRMAGTRTTALVAAGAAIFVMCGFLISGDLSAQGRIKSTEDEDATAAHIRAEVITPGRNNEAVEQVVVRLSVENATITASWAILIRSTWS